MTSIRPETSDDYTAVREVNRSAFNRDSEARLVDNLRQGGAISLVAEVDGQVVGHILFSPITIETQEGSIPAQSLAPMAVLPDFQNQGIGSRLVLQGLEECRRLGHRIVIVLGHPNFYPRFGFSPAHSRGIKAPFEVPDEAWMAVELQPGALNGVRGLVLYPPAFDDV